MASSLLVRRFLSSCTAACSLILLVALAALAAPAGAAPSFRLGVYDSPLPPEIDSTLVWNTFLGALSTDEGYGIAVDSSGNVYVTGYGFQTWGSPVRAPSGHQDAFVAKLDASGALVWNTFLGASVDDGGRSIAVDTSGNVYVTGYSFATWGSPLRSFSGGDDTFVAKLDASGALVWNTFLGGSAYDEGYGIAVDTSDNVYVTGHSLATWGNPLRSFSGDASDAFVAKLDATGALMWHTFLGGSNADFGRGIVVHSGGNLYVAGSSCATWGSPLRSFSGGICDAFAAKLDASGALVWNTFLGGSNADYGTGIAVDTRGNVYVGGSSDASWGSQVPAFSGSFSSTHAFAAKLDASGALVWSTFLGSSGTHKGYGIGVDTRGNAYVTGLSSAPWGSPVSPFSGCNDILLAKLDANGALVWNTFLGGTQCDNGFAIAVNASGNLYVTGDSGVYVEGSAAWGDPVRPFSGSADAFVASVASSASVLEIHYINPSIQAGVTLVIGPDGTTVLMDAGKAGDIIPDYLAGIRLVAGVNDLDYTIAGHLDADHIRGFKDVFPVTGAGYDVSAAGANYFNGSDKTNTTITTYKNAAANTTAGAPVPVPLDTVIPLGDGATLKVVAVHGNITGGDHVSVPNENDRSVAVLIEYGDFDYLWASDLGGGDDPDCTDRDGVSSADVETPLAQAITPGGDAPMLSSSGVEVLHVNYHGSEASTNCHWMSLLNPDVALISVGPNSQGNPGPVVVDDVLRVGSSCACLSGVPPALVLQTDEGDTATGSTTGYVVGDILIMSDGTSYGIDATGVRVTGSPDERGAAGIPSVILVDEKAPNCPMEQVLPSTVVTTTEEWKAKHRILSTGSFTVGTGGAVTLEAGTRVVLGDGFSVGSGGSLEVIIKPLTDCS